MRFWILFVSSEEAKPRAVVRIRQKTLGLRAAETALIGDGGREPKLENVNEYVKGIEHEEYEVEVSKDLVLDNESLMHAFSDSCRAIVTVPNEALNEFADLRWRYHHRPDGTLDADPYYKINEAALVNEWAAAGAPERWDPTSHDDEAVDSETLKAAIASELWRNPGARKYFDVLDEVEFDGATMTYAHVIEQIIERCGHRAIKVLTNLHCQWSEEYEQDRE